MVKIKFELVTALILISFVIFYSGTITGLESSILNSTEITKAEAVDLISQSETIIIQMEDNGFGTNYVKDLLIEEKKVFEQARYAEILRNGNLNENETNEARIALRLINWKSLNYNLVIDYFNKIKQARDQAMDLKDSLSVLDSKIRDYSSSGINLSPEDLNLLEEAKKALQEERYSDAESLIKQARDSIESSRIETSRISVITSNTRDFIQENWIYLTITLLIVIICIVFISKIVKKRKIQNKITLGL